jgi:hypothetical protein
VELGAIVSQGDADAALRGYGHGTPQAEACAT